MRWRMNCFCNTDTDIDLVPWELIPAVFLMPLCFVDVLDFLDVLFHVWGGGEVVGEVGRLRGRFGGGFGLIVN